MLASPVQVCVVHGWPFVHSEVTAQNCAPAPASAPGHDSPSANVVHAVSALPKLRAAQQTWPLGQSHAEAHSTTTLSAPGQPLAPSASLAMHVEGPEQSPVLPIAASFVGQLKHSEVPAIGIAPLLVHETVVPRTIVPQQSLLRRSHVVEPHCGGI
jgi:hypothetical protein